MSLLPAQEERPDAAILRDVAGQITMAVVCVNWHSHLMAKAPKSESKEDRLAEALRANLKRRKAQNRGRKAEAKESTRDAPQKPENGAD